MFDASETLMTLYRPPHTTQGIVDAYLNPLGFTIYRTDYNNPTTSDQLWQLLLDRLEVDLKQEILKTFQDRQHIPEEREAVEKLISLVRFDGRSDAALSGYTIDQLREVFLNRVGGNPLNADNPVKQFFLVADDEVLNAVSHGQYWVKIVEVHYDDAFHCQTNHPRYSMPQKYWGLMKVSTTSLLYTWTSLDCEDLCRIAPQVLKGQDFPIMDETYVAE